MPFRIKDLLINVLPPGKEDPDCGDTGWPDCGGTEWCGGTWCPHSPPVYPCYVHAKHCLGTPTVHWTPWQFAAMRPADPDAAAKQLSTMKAQLKQSLAEIEEHEKRIGERSQPQTVEEIEALQSKLREALDELERRKSDLKKR